LHLPSDPIYPSQVVEVPLYDEQAPLEVTQPLPVVTHPFLNASQSSSVESVSDASEQATTLHVLPSATPLHFPSLPLLLAHITSSPVKAEHAPNGDFPHPYPVVTHPI
jgi:hypothetical protein